MWEINRKEEDQDKGLWALFCHQARWCKWECTIPRKGTRGSSTQFYKMPTTLMSLLYNQSLSPPDLCHKILPGGNSSAVTSISGAVVQQLLSHAAWYGWGQRSSTSSQLLGQSPVIVSTMSGRLSSREVNVSSPDDERNWTVWGLVLNPLVKTHYYVQGPLLLPLNGNKC